MNANHGTDTTRLRKREYEAPQITTLGVNELLESIGPALATVYGPPNFFGEDW